MCFASIYRYRSGTSGTTSGVLGAASMATLISRCSRFTGRGPGKAVKTCRRDFSPSYWWPWRAARARATASAAVVAGNTGWFWSNPLPQGNTLTKADTIAGRAYVAGEAGTIMRSDNGGATWTGIRSGLPAALSDVQDDSRDHAPTRSSSPATADCAGLTTAARPSGDSRGAPATSRCASTITSLSFPTTRRLPAARHRRDPPDRWTAATHGARRPRPAARLLPRGGSGRHRHLVQLGDDRSGQRRHEHLLHDRLRQLLDHRRRQSRVAASCASSSSRATTDTPSATSLGLYKTINGGATWTPVAGNGTLEANAVSSLSCADADHLPCRHDRRREHSSHDRWRHHLDHAEGVNARDLRGRIHDRHARARGGRRAALIVATDDAGQNWTPINSEAAGAVLPRARGQPDIGRALRRRNRHGAHDRRRRELQADRHLRHRRRSSTRHSRPRTVATCLTRATSSRVRTTAASPGRFLTSLARTRTRSTHRARRRSCSIGSKGVRRSEDAGISFKTAGKTKFRKLKFSSVDKAGSAVVVYGSSNIAVSKDDGKNWTVIKKSQEDQDDQAARLR